MKNEKDDLAHFAKISDFSLIKAYMVPVVNIHDDQGKYKEAINQNCQKAFGILKGLSKASDQSFEDEVKECLAHFNNIKELTDAFYRYFKPVSMLLNIDEKSEERIKDITLKSLMTEVDNIKLEKIKSILLTMNES